MEKYFAAANSSVGFVSWFDEIFAPEDFDRIFLIKGGSGTGKSTLMRKIADRAGKNGLDCEYFYCSSDPDSLDGLIVKCGSKPIGIVDATAPHTRDPKLPGAVEKIINHGEFWDENALRSSREEISGLIREKSKLFAESYEYLSVAGEMSKTMRNISESTVNKTKMRAAADRLIEQKIHEAKKSLKKSDFSDAPALKIRCVSAISTKGERHFDSFRDSESLCVVEDVMSTAPMMFDALIDSARRAKLDVIRAPIPLETELSEAIRVPALGFSAVLGRKNEPDDVKRLNMERFIDRGAITLDDKRHYRLLSKCKNELIDCALDKLSEIRELHSRVESIYVKAMDFERLNKFTENLLNEIIH